MVDGVVATASYRKNCLRTQTVGIDKPIKWTGHSQIHLLEKEWSEPEQVSSLVKLLLSISILKREGHDKLSRCSKMSINWPNAQDFWRCRQLMQNRKSILCGLMIRLAFFWTVNSSALWFTSNQMTEDGWLLGSSPIFNVRKLMKNSMHIIDFLG